MGGLAAITGVCFLYSNIMITGSPGVGKTWIACALAQKAYREGNRALYLRLPKLL